MRSAELSGLLERVKKATGPDRELDARILCALLAPEGALVERSKWNGAWCISVPAPRHPSGQRDWETPAPWRFEHMGLTASIDAAVALVEPALPGLISPDCLLSDALDRMGREGWNSSESIQSAIARFVVIELLSALIEKESDDAES